MNLWFVIFCFATYLLDFLFLFVNISNLAATLHSLFLPINLNLYFIIMVILRQCPRLIFCKMLVLKISTPFCFFRILILPIKYDCYAGSGVLYFSYSNKSRAWIWANALVSLAIYHNNVQLFYGVSLSTFYL